MRITKEQVRQSFDWMMANSPPYSMDNSGDELWNLYLASFVRIVPHDNLDDELFKLRCNLEEWIRE